MVILLGIMIFNVLSDDYILVIYFKEPYLLKTCNEEFMEVRIWYKIIQWGRKGDILIIVEPGW